MVQVGIATMPRDRRSKPRPVDDKFHSRQLLTAADATVVLVDKQLERLQRAADLYRERLEAGMEQHRGT